MNRIIFIILFLSVLFNDELPIGLTEEERGKMHIIEEMGRETGEQRAGASEGLKSVLHSSRPPAALVGQLLQRIGHQPDRPKQLRQPFLLVAFP